MPPKRFVFRLETVLTVRLAKEDEEKKKYGDLIQLLAQEQKRLAYLEQQLVEARVLRKTLCEDQTKHLDYLELKRIEGWEKKLETKDIRTKKRTGDIPNQEARVAEVEAALEMQRIALIEAMKERKIIETLKEQQQEAFNREMDEEEAKMIDELATLKYARDAGKNDEE